MTAKLKHLQNKKNMNCDVRVILHDTKKTNVKQALILNYNSKKRKPIRRIKAKAIDKSQVYNSGVESDKKTTFYCNYYEYIDQEERDINKTVKFLDWYLKEKKLSSNK